MSEAKVAVDINEFFLVFDLNDLTSDGEIYESLDSASKYSKSSGDVHTELKLKLKDNYNVKYPDYEKIVENLRIYIENAKQKLSALKKEAEEGRKRRQKMCPKITNTSGNKNKRPFCNLNMIFCIEIIKIGDVILFLKSEKEFDLQLGTWWMCEND